MERSLLSLVVALALSGCGSAEEEASSAPSGAPGTTTSAAPAHTVEPLVASTQEPSAATNEGATPADETPTDSIESAAAVVDPAGWAERERRTFVLQGAARGEVASM
jgi:hypothetical protein